MGNLCPKDFKFCMDDLCRASNCCVQVGAALYFECYGCGHLISDEDTQDCTCEAYDWTED